MLVLLLLLIKHEGKKSIVEQFDESEESHRYG
jgi:hypothetical protein